MRNVRLRGLGSEYTSVTIDGVSLASADANAGAAANARAFTMEMASLNSMESIEVSKTISADVDANAPAGTINLKTKRAFDRAGRRVSWEATAVMHSEEFSLHRTPGPDDDRSSLKIRPGGIFEYSDVFLNKRLGIVFNLSDSNVYQEALITSLTYNRTPTSTDPRPQVITSLNFQHAPRFNQRFATTLTTDFRATPLLALSLGVVYNYADLWTPQRTVIFNTGARNTVVGDDPLTSFSSNNASANVVVNPVAVSKMGETFTLLPKFEYKRGNASLEGKFAYSDATSWYDPLGHQGTIRDANSPTATGVNFRATRSSAMDMDWKFTQLSGPDIGSGASFSNPSLTVNDGRFSRSLLASGEIVGTLKTFRFLPVTWKTGLKDRYELRKFEDDQLVRRYDYIGPGAASTGTWAGYPSAYPYDLGMNNGRVTSSSGRNVFMPDLKKLGTLYREHPEYFRQNVTPDNYYESYVARRRRYEEEVYAAYFMGTASLGRRATVRAGLRWEQTNTDSTEPDSRRSAEVRDAGYPVNSSGRASTIPGIDYQFLSRPRLHRTARYDRFFPSGSFKYAFARNLDLHLGFSSTIRRPTYSDVSGVWTIDDTALRVNSPNPFLKPETSRNYAARLAYYFEPVGQLSMSLFQNNVKNLILSNNLTAEEFGYTGTDLANYIFVTKANSDTDVTLRGMELEYRQALSFLGEKFKRLNFRAAYTRNYARNIIKTELTPHMISSGFDYTYKRFNSYVNLTWSDNYPLTTTGLSYRRHRTNLDAGGGWRLTKNVTLSVAARDLLNSPYINLQRVAPNAAVITRHEITGISYTFAVKGTY